MDYSNIERKYSLVIFLFFLSYIPFEFVLSHFKVEYLPGFDGTLPFTLRTGYIGVDEGDEVQLFYYFLESENVPKEDPLLLWFTGGPCCSAISAILFEIGPLKFEEVRYNGSVPKLLWREYAWSKMVNILFIDVPVGTGFSYSKTQRQNYSGDFRTSFHVNQFLRKWLLSYPEFVSNPLYIGGDSYSGFTLPLFVHDMIHGNEQGMKPFLNLKGYLLGNPSTDRSIDHNHIVPFSHGMGLISDELFEALEGSCGGEYHNVDSSNVECVKNINAFEAGLNGIQPVMILEKYCGVATPRPRGGIVNDMYGRSRRSVTELRAFSCRKKEYELVYDWMGHESVKEALHVRKRSIGIWRRCNFEFNYSYEILSSINYHENLSAKGLRSLIYSGDHDMVVPYSGTQAWIRSLNYSILHDWRRWWVDAQIAGYTRTYSNRMTFATIKGAGHTAPEYKPKECANMFMRWIHGNPL